jgi:hypothetical protein
MDTVQPVQSPQDLNPRPQRLLTFASGGWVILVTALMTLGLLTWGLAPALLRSFNRPPGDGKSPETFGFDLSSFKLPRAQLAAAMLHRDLVPALIHPTASGPDDSNPENRWRAMQKKNDLKYGKYLVPSDLVIGVTINGESRAYPLNVIIVHEIINDTLGGVPIVVTYNWVCDSIAAYDRRVGDQTLEFAHSGLVYNSNPLMYDRTQETEDRRLPKSSLWTQLLGQAVSGPAAEKNAQLKAIPAERITWGQWSEIHPDTTVLDRDNRIAARYKGATPTGYLQSEKLEDFPVDPLPPSDSMPLKSHVVVIEVAGQQQMYPIADAIRACDEQGQGADSFNGAPLRITCDRTHQTVRIENAETGEPVTIKHALWYAWHAMTAAPKIES